MSLCTDVAVVLHMAISVMEHQVLGAVQDLFLLYFSFLGEKGLLRYRDSCSGLPCLWQGEGSVINFGSFSSFF